jgi:hypothetical protein
MLFTYGRFLSRELVNTVSSDHLLFKVVSGLIKYQMFICYFLYIAGKAQYILQCGNFILYYDSFEILHSCSSILINKDLVQNRVMSL